MRIQVCVSVLCGAIVCASAVATERGGSVVAVGSELHLVDGKAQAGPATVTTSRGDTLKIPGLGMEFVPVRPGTFAMGSPTSEKDHNDDEAQHQVTLTQSFWMGKYEVTQAEYEAVIGKNPSKFQGDRNPVESVSWNGAVAFCAKLTERERRAGRLPNGYVYRLPTEAEWEYCCRAGTTTAYCFGDDSGRLAEYANYDDTPNYGDESTAPVGSFKPNAWGLHDMHGNVYEWCLDWCGEDYARGSVTDPVGPTSGATRVYRGGSWFNSPRFCRSARRSGSWPGYAFEDLGFRVGLARVPGGQRNGRMSSH